jgi:hypothetical protein
MCRGCALHKNSKDSFPRRNGRSKGILDIIHSDVTRPMSITSVEGLSYYVISIDEFWKTWIFFMKSKDEVLSQFQEFKNQVES